MPISNPRKRPICVARSFLSRHATTKEELSQAVSRLESLTKQGIRLPFELLASLLQRCGDTKSLKQGKWIHRHLKITGFKRPNTLLSNHLIGMYMKCGKPIDACKVFDQMHLRNLYSWNNMVSGFVKSGMLARARVVFDSMPERDVVSWNTMVIGYAQNGNLHEALWFYKELRRSGIKYNDFSFAGLLTACVKSRQLQLNRQAHGQVLIAGLLSNVVLSCSLIDAYAKCGQMESAKRCFDEMAVKDVHLWTTLISGYAKLGDMEAADKLFCEMPEKNPVSWTALIAGYVRQGSGDQALDLFRKMIALRVKPEQFTFSSCLCASASIASLRHGKQIHGYMIRSNVRPNPIVISSLIDMYSKSGSLKASEQVFSLCDDRQDCVLWNTMISALAQHGLGHKALRLLDEMIKSRVHPNRTTLVVVLNACSHSGLIEEGVRWFNSMTVQHAIVPDQEHYACLIDLLGRAGCFKELMCKIEEMPFEPDEQIWNAIVGVSKIHGNVELGKKAAEELIKLDPDSSAPYILLSGIYAEHGKWESVEKLREIMKKRRVNKEKAVSWIEIEKKVEAFTVSDVTHAHARKEEIYFILHNLAALMEEEASRT
ncbi:PREDICTED: pentatricopeptide repeat-containing protein At2g21090-like [Camelina sativa]|uniref:Pentatricopeptide repeat-containing protein At2g21090-like n=1 Tax=Camelina sativa TaxID=90675 RepID=A0ABM1Q9K5_CAMSA|nr:PREDICTED: pentatricopeptide repeat-containing protein At2g21090-like [Camelina sativa]